MQNWQLIRDGKLSKKVFIQRALILDLIREWFRRQGFLEVETPLMLKYPGMEPYLNIFSSDFVSEDLQYRDKRFLHTSPEYSMKKLLGAGFEKIFQITKVFRNGEVSLVSNMDIPSPSHKIKAFPDHLSFNQCPHDLSAAISQSIPLNTVHNPEFTMLEWYRANVDYTMIMNDCESMITFIVQKLQIENEDLKRFLSQDWERLSIREAFVRYADLDINELRTVEVLKPVIEEKGYEMNTEYTWDDLFFLIFLNEIEPKLGFEKPVFLYDYPASQAALSQKKENDPFWSERFELYIRGVELCNAFTELVDPVEQRIRLEEESQLRKDLGKEIYDIDESFLEALETMPPSGGNALGIDRLVMVLLGKKSIEQVLLFPWADVS